METQAYEESFCSARRSRARINFLVEGEAEEESIFQCKDNQRKNQFCSGKGSRGRVNFAVQRGAQEE